MASGLGRSILSAFKYLLEISSELSSGWNQWFSLVLGWKGMNCYTFSVLSNQKLWCLNWWYLPLSSKAAHQKNQGFHVWGNYMQKFCMKVEAQCISNTSPNWGLRLNASKLKECHWNSSRVGNSAIINSSEKHGSSVTQLLK